ncbi:MAG: TolC family protein [Phycisphaeraceae bacterium]|nr:TolC family protein [Phycisphaeraceae bacterium]
MKSLSAGVLAGVLVLSAGCATPFRDVRTEETLRRSLVETVRRELAAPARAPDRTLTQRESSLEAFIRDMNLQTRVRELDALAGPQSWNFDAEHLPMGEDLQGQVVRTVGITLEDAIRLAVQNNLQVQFARLAPAVNEAQVQQAEAAFDWVFSASLEAERTRRPTADRGTSPLFLQERTRKEDSITFNSGFRRQLVTGGQFSVQHRFRYSELEESGFFSKPNPSHDMDTSLQFDLPLLRGFGSDVTLAEVRLAKNAEREAIALLKRDVIRIALETEREYWRLLQAHRDVLILKSLLDRGVEVFGQVRARSGLDADPAQVASASARVEERRANLISAQNLLRRSSDRLKVLINDPHLPVSGQVLLLPLNDAPDAPIVYSIADAIASAIEHRPEIDQAILSIDDATVRRLVADNRRLPQLDLRLQTRINALDRRLGGAYEESVDAQFIDFLAGLFFEQPIGNRSAEALFRQRSLEREQAVLSFKNTVQQVTLEVKNALDNAVTSYQLIEQRKIARLAAAETLRVLLTQKRTTGGFTIERLEVELNRQEGLANAERAEVQAMVDYNVSIAELHSAMGLLLERNRIRFVVPDNPGASRR